jgi:hypothetical protein
MDADVGNSHYQAGYFSLDLLEELKPSCAHLHFSG